ncbi:hypothetical protein EV363DRAFT_1265641 [Boletus edulis]|nr:hypothetical protein EV363DRAFT_1265641 [Boletus edulis]
MPSEEEVEKKYNLITRRLREVLRAGRPRPAEEPLQPDMALFLHKNYLTAFRAAFTAVACMSTAHYMLRVTPTTCPLRELRAPCCASLLPRCVLREPCCVPQYKCTCTSLIKE